MQVAKTERAVTMRRAAASAATEKRTAKRRAAAATEKRTATATMRRAAAATEKRTATGKLHWFLSPGRGACLGVALAEGAAYPSASRSG